MEIIEMSGYTIEEKVEIAKNHLLPKQLKEHGLTEKDLQIGKKQLEKIIVGYTRESGVRGLEKKIAQMVRHAAKSIRITSYNVCYTKLLRSEERFCRTLAVNKILFGIFVLALFLLCFILFSTIWSRQKYN